MPFVPMFTSSGDDEEETTNKPLPTNPTPEDWVENGDTGNAAVAIWCVMTGNVAKDGVYQTSNQTYYYRVPKNDAAFYRCYKLLKYFPQWRKQLNKVSSTFPEWEGFVMKWGQLESICDANPMSKDDALNNRDYHNQELNKLIKELYRESETDKRKVADASSAQPEAKRGLFSGFSQIVRDMKSKEK